MLRPTKEFYNFSASLSQDTHSYLISRPIRPCSRAGAAWRPQDSQRSFWLASRRRSALRLTCKAHCSVAKFSQVVMIVQTYVSLSNIASARQKLVMTFLAKPQFRTILSLRRDRQIQNLPKTRSSPPRSPQEQTLTPRVPLPRSALKQACHRRVSPLWHRAVLIEPICKRPQILATNNWAFPPLKSAQ